MPEIKDEDLGRRIFQLQKEKAVEETIDKIRHTTGLEWMSITPSEREILEFLLGEAWVSINRDDWEKYAFSRLTMKDLQDIISIGRDLKSKEIVEDAAINKLVTIFQQTFN